MGLSWTLSRYFSVQFIASTAMCFAIFVSTAFIFDMVELMREVARADVGFGLLLTMSILKLPTLVEQMAAYTILAGAMWTFLRLTRSHELVIARAAGVSAWQFLTPVLATTLVLGVFMVLLINPMAAAMRARYEQLDATKLSGRANLVAVSESGIWLRQSDDNGQAVIHAARTGSDGIELQDVVVFIYDATDRFVERLDARSAKLSGGAWRLSQVWLNWHLNKRAEYRESYTMPTNITTAEIQESSTPPETVSVLELPEFIDVLEKAGLTAKPHRLHFQSVISSPLLYAAMVLIAAAFSLRLTRQGGVAMMVVGGVSVAFLLFFLSNLALVLGRSGNLPVLIAAWAPALVAALLGLAMLFHSEDG